jgi:ATP-binding cassette subfamily F protein uup
MTLLNVRDLTKHYGPRVLFERINFVINEGEKVGLIGPNGCGKTTLFHILAGHEPADEGDIALRRGATVGYLPQDPPFEDGVTSRQAVAEALTPARDALAAFDDVSRALTEATDPKRQATLLDEQARLLALVERLDAWSWEHRVEDNLTRLGLPVECFDRSVSSLSGGQRRRVALARVLLQQPDLLILDEPTNHLDTDTIELLEDRLCEYPGALLLVTHDRYFLENVVDRILEVDPEGLLSHPGSYEAFMERKLERLEQRQVAEHKRKQSLARELEWLRRSPKARSTKSRSRIQRAEGLMQKGLDGREQQIQLSFQTDQRLGNIILEVEGLYKSLDPNIPLLRDVNLKLRAGDHLALLGPNGCGKSTFIKLLLGDLLPDSGTVRWGKNAKIGYIDQARSGLDPQKTVFETLSDTDFVDFGGRRLHKHSYLADFLFGYGDQHKRADALSGGERCRLLMAKLVLEGANVLVLDEPTNDLDIQSLQVLEQALIDFKGCVLLVTHDRYLVNRACNAILGFEFGAFVRYDGDYDFYKARRPANVLIPAGAPAAAPVAAPVAGAPPKPAPKKRSARDQKDLSTIEARIQDAERDKAALEAQLADPDLYRRDLAAAQALTRKLEAASQAIDALYARWAELEEASP